MRTSLDIPDDLYGKIKVARKEDHNIVATGESLKIDVSFLVRP